MSTVTNSAGSEVHLYVTRQDALYVEVIEPLLADPDAADADDVYDLYDVEAIADEVLEWRAETFERNGQTFEWLNDSGYCYALDTEDTNAFWDVVLKHTREPGVVEVTAFEDNGGFIHVSNGRQAWVMGPDYRYSSAGLDDDLTAWEAGDWEPSDRDGQVREPLGDYVETMARPDSTVLRDKGVAA